MLPVQSQNACLRDWYVMAHQVLEGFALPRVNDSELSALDARG